ncbi:hypothetical protein QTP70_025011, partial [Hemibagrus guttatus]
MRHLSLTSLLCLLMVERTTCHGNAVTNFDGEFRASLYQALVEKDNSSNLIVSPASISLSLRLLQLGARGNTLAQIERTMRYDISTSEAGEEATEASWWATVPHMAFLSSVEFRGTWQTQFLSRGTQNLPFSLANGSTVKVPMMYQSSEVKFGQFYLPSDQRYAVLELPYFGKSLSLLLVIPSERKTPLSLFQAQLTSRTVTFWDAGLRHTKMDIFLPRFKLQSRLNLKPVLESLGISDAFDPFIADFSGIS